MSRQHKLMSPALLSGFAPVTGFQLRNGDRWARPVGVAVGPDGALYFTGDSATNGLFRLRRSEAAGSDSGQPLVP